jgi:bifunctional DNA-binding transcriptional regulator/antitoxin component of YhaV-PrlF toxin-antitoxin module
MNVRAAEQLLTSLVPTAQVERASFVEPLPLASPSSGSSVDGTLRYAVGRIDVSGSVPAASLLSLLEWHPGDRVGIVVRRGVAIARRDPTGQVAVTKRRALVIPVAARRACGICNQDSLLLAAAVEYDTVFVHPPSIVDKMMTLYHRSGDDV